MDSQKLEKRLSDIEAMLLGTKKVLNLEEVAAYTGLSKSYLYKLTSTGQIPHYKPNGKHIYFSKEEIDQWLLRNVALTTEAQSRDAATYVTLNPRKQ